jgi:putative ABC transport system permease protein
VAVSERFLRQRGLAIGDTVTVAAGGQRTRVRIVGQILVNAPVIFSNWATLTLLAPDTRADSYEVQLRSGTDVSSYLAAIRVADPGLDAFPPDSDTDSFTAIVISLVTLLTLMLGAVAALGVFNTVVLNARERRRDLGMLKSIGMTPGQVTVMMVTSMAALGAVGGLLGIPFGIVAHRLVVPAMARAAQVGFPDFMLNVYHPLTLVLLALAGVAIAVLGAYLPARSAARTTIAEVLHNE